MAWINLYHPSRIINGIISNNVVVELMCLENVVRPSKKQQKNNIIKNMELVKLTQ